MKKKSSIFFVVAILILIGAFFWLDSGKVVAPGDGGEENVPEDPNADLPQAPEIFDNPNLGKLNPATCSIGGALVYTEKNNFTNQSAILKYKNVDSPARHIIWRIEPEIKASIGPNLFSQLTLPTGQTNIAVVFDEETLAKEYTLRAKVTYGQFIEGDLKIFESECSGQTRVKINF
ncbi:MAG: hypothetical protein COV31_03290 [Candidatus Yanofskybacteria bacterium CG10_big_fil_rev_8_21_14_0_10_46_23]|uniref:Uncharacterized protein n=1 Tax=Candidatus Yanofskybacteria bacterium CG10_big_fil_rev_8_21_14_0_10_46_23 TaxID=1975098 RepID=A0A2H0R414_9BACT|nr:MAG: hypothetical protein COV31_03290 [Candidatus Yanofskybacteria bacterium CG10_big_fil_rev_8_21_14_0_10_46_23]